MKIWYALVKRWVALGLHLYFRRIRVIGTEHIPGKGAVMFTANHQNAFLDALLIATTNQRLTHFLVRADVFNSRWYRLFFSSLNMMPVYRIRDGRDSLSKNQLIFQRCAEILSRDQALMVFPEGNHHQHRRLLPLSKGFTRIIANARSQNIDLKIVPVGINYSHHRRFGGSVSIYYGEPLESIDFSIDDHISSLDLRNLVASGMKKLITHIPRAGNSDVLKQHLDVNPWNYLDPVGCNAWVAQNNHQMLEAPVAARSAGPSLFWNGIRGLSYWLHWPPLSACKKLLKRLGDPVFTSSVKVLVGLILFPLYYLLVGALTYFLFGAIMAIAVVIFCVALLQLRKISLVYQYPDTKEGIQAES